MRFGSMGEPLRWYSSQPAKCGPVTFHFWRLPSDSKMNAPFLVPTKTRTVDTYSSMFRKGFVKGRAYSDGFSCLVFQQMSSTLQAGGLPTRRRLPTCTTWLWLIAEVREDGLLGLRLHLLVGP